MHYPPSQYYRKCWRDLFKMKKHLSKTGIKNGNNYIPINKYLKWKRIKCSNLDRVAEWIRKQDPYICCLQGLTSV